MIPVWLLIRTHRQNQFTAMLGVSLLGIIACALSCGHVFVQHDIFPSKAQKKTRSA